LERKESTICSGEKDFPLTLEKEGFHNQRGYPMSGLSLKGVLGDKIYYSKCKYESSGETILLHSTKPIHRKNYAHEWYIGDFQ
jgi:hypothetical protein